MADPRIIARLGEYFIRADQVREGDLLDLEGDLYADPNGDSIGPDGHFYGFEFEFAEVIEPVIVETADCVLIHTEKGSFGFPPDHLIETTLADKRGLLCP